MRRKTIRSSESAKRSSVWRRKFEPVVGEMGRPGLCKRALPGGEFGSSRRVLDCPSTGAARPVDVKTTSYRRLDGGEAGPDPLPKRQTAYLAAHARHGYLSMPGTKARCPHGRHHP